MKPPTSMRRHGTRRHVVSAMAISGVLAGTLALSGCASLAPQGDMAAITQLTAERTAGVALDAQAVSPASAEAERARAVGQLLQRQPLAADDAVRIALLNSPAVQASLAQLRISDAQRVQAALLPNPHIALGRVREGSTREVERALGFNLLGILALPWRSEWQGQQHELSRLQAAQELVRTAADARKAWVRAVAAQQAADYAEQARDAASAAAELARSMARVGNASRYQQAKEQAVLAEVTAQLAKARHAAVAEREQLLRTLGLWGAQAQITLPAQLPALPPALAERRDIESQALRERLDVRSALLQADQAARAVGYARVTGYVSALDLTVQRSVTRDLAHGEREVARGLELELPLPLFDWGGAATAQARARYELAAAQVHQTAVQARSEVREAWHGWRTAYDLARHYRDEIVPLRRFITDETLLRYNGMLTGVFDLLADTRTTISAVGASVDALRDFWLIDTDLRTALTATSPGGLAALRSSASAGPADSGKGH